MPEKMLSITCPICGRKYEKPVGELAEGADLTCPRCGVKLNLHGHMWKDLQNEIAALGGGD
ncbi:MAG: transposase [Acidobacteriota bacterium]|jgi:DNA-directed RNA polymerase subunit RPC12/RpoP|nr:transposase [Acidobacteriota bacterium]